MVAGRTSRTLTTEPQMFIYAIVLVSDSNLETVVQLVSHESERVFNARLEKKPMFLNKNLGF